MKHYMIGVFSGVAMLTTTVLAAAEVPNMLSGGVGAESRAKIESVQKDYDLKLVFTGDQGMYLSGVGVDILNKKGETVGISQTEGPYLLVDLEPGTYTVKATVQGIEKKRNISVDGKHLKTAHIRFPVKDEPVAETEQLSVLKSRMDNTTGLTVDQVFSGGIAQVQ